jgi:hypothetical protein
MAHSFLRNNLPYIIAVGVIRFRNRSEDGICALAAGVAPSERKEGIEPMEQPSSEPSQPTTETNRVAEYVRVSTEHQECSTESQREVIREYAERRGMTIVRTYTDAGISGLRASALPSEPVDS